VEIINLPAGNSIVDTGLQQPGQALGNSSTSEPPLGIPGTSPPLDGTTPASRVMVIPMPPTWPATLDIGEPYFDTTSGTVKVPFKNFGAAIPRLNVLFWDPHSLVGPGLASTYAAATGTTGATGATGFTGQTFG
jgi:hypothetical protein